MKNRIIERKHWVIFLSGFFLFVFFFSIASYFQPLNYALYSALFITTSMMLIYLINDLIIFPRFHKDSKKFVIISIITIIGFSAIYFFLEKTLIPHVSSQEFKEPPVFFHFMRMFTTTSFIYFISTTVNLFENNQKLLEKEKILNTEKLEMELKLLRAQINPHFIFNALNNIYSLSYLKTHTAPDAILKLSEMLRYIFYDCSVEQVPLSSEIKYIENFISFQQMKSDHSQNITFQTNVRSKKTEVAPMLFIPFIENAFKYSRIEDNPDAFVSISITTGNDDLHFIIENNLDPDNKPASGSGTGIKNVKHRLSILYPAANKLTISENKDSYKVELKISPLNNKKDSSFPLK